MPLGAISVAFKNMPPQCHDTGGGEAVPHIHRPLRTRLALLAASVAGFVLLACTGLARHPALAAAILFGYGFAASVEEILRYGLIQSHTPDSHLGRVNSLWAAQETGGTAIGSLGAGGLGRYLAPGPAIVAYGTVSAVLALVLALTLTTLRTATLSPTTESDR